MALPKGVKSQVDYTKLYMSNELEGEVLDEKFGAFVQKGLKALSKVPIRKVGIAGVGLGAITGIGAAIKSALDKRREKKIKQDVDKYVSDRQLKGGPKKVEYKPNDQYTVTRDKKGKVTGTGKLIRVQPGTRTIMRMPEPGERTSTKSRFSQHTGSPFKASPLNKNKNIYGLSDKKEKTPLQKKYDLNKVLEATMTPAQKRKDTMLKKKYEKSDDMMKSFKDQYGKEKGKNVFYAFIRKKSMEEENIQEILDKKDVPHVKKLVKKLRDGSKTHAKQADNLEKAMNENLGATPPKVAPSSDMMKKNLVKKEPLTKQSLDKRKADQANITSKMNQLGGITKTTTQNGKLSSMSIQSVGAGTNKAALASVLPKSGTGLKMDADGVVPDAGAAVQQKATQGIQMGQNMMNKSGAQFTSSQKQDFNTAKNYASSGQIKTDINRQIPGTQQFRYDIAADEINLASQKNKPKMNKGIKIGMQKEDISDEALNIQDWNSDDINFTEIETVDIIKPKPLIPSPSNWREELGEDWQKVNKKDKTDGMSQKAVNAYKRENPGSKLKTAVTTKPSKLKKGSKASKRRKSFCARSNGQKKMHNIDCSKTPDKAICKARRRWNC